jgi:DNA-binding NtrC family response regulator
VADLLLVDDDLELTDALAEFLRAEGHLVRVACNGQEGIGLLAERRPDLVMLDVEMPLMNGPEMAYRMFLHNSGDEKVPIVLLSGVLDLPGVARIVGTPYFLGKPYVLDALLVLIARALGERTAPDRRQLANRS